MSRTQRELSIAQRRRRRHVTPSRNNDNDLVGIPWKEERDIRKAIYHSLREHQNQSTSERRSRGSKVNSPTNLVQSSKVKTRSRQTSLGAKKARVTKKAFSEKSDKLVTPTVENADTGISKSPHPRKSRPLPGDLSHQFLFASSYSRSFALLTSRAASRVARRTLARAAVAEVASTPVTGIAIGTNTTVRDSTPVPPRRGRGRPPSLSSPTKSQRGRPPKISKQLQENERLSPPTRRKKAEANGDFMEVLVESDHGKIVSQIVPKASNCHKTTSLKSPVLKSIPATRNTTKRSIRLSPRQQTLSVLNSPEKWQDSQGQPVNVQDFVDFLCSYGTPCMDQKLAWFMNAPGHRSPSTSTRSARSPTGSSCNNRKGTVRIFPSCSSPKISIRPVIAPQQNHKAPVLPVARKSVSNWPVPLPEDIDDWTPQKRSAVRETTKMVKEAAGEFTPQKSKSSPIVIDEDEEETVAVNGTLMKKQEDTMKKMIRKTAGFAKNIKKPKLEAKAKVVKSTKLPLINTRRKVTLTKSLRSPNRSPLRPPLSRSGLRSQALLRTRRQQRLLRQ